MNPSITNDMSCMCMPLRIVLPPFTRMLSALFCYMQADINDLHLGVATGRVPPGWLLEGDAKYPLRHWIRDIEVWAASTDVADARIGPSCAQRITGAARLVVREIPIQTLIQGAVVPDANGNPVQVSGIGMLVRILERRYGAAPQEVQIHSISELMGFVRGHQESTDGVLARFEILLNRAEQQGGVVFGPQVKSWLLLSHLRIPRSSWFTLLSPTLGMLPSDAQEYIDFAQYLRRNGHLYDKTPADSQKTLAQPYFVTDGDGATPAPTFHTSWPEFRTSNDMTYDDDEISWHSFSTGMSDDDEPLDWDDFVNVSQQHIGEAVYLAYRGAKRRWRKFSGKARPRFKGHGKGKGGRKGSGKGKSQPPRTFWTDDYGNHHVVPEAPEADLLPTVYFKGKGKGNPIGKDGKVMLCSTCDSDQHFRAKCPKGSGKGGMGSGKGKNRTFFLGPDAPDASNQTPSETPVQFRPSYFSMPPSSSALSEFSHIHFADGTPSITLAPASHNDVALNIQLPGIPTNALMSSSSYYPVWGNSAYHARVKLDHGEAMLVDTLSLIHI